MKRFLYVYTLSYRLNLLNLKSLLSHGNYKKKTKT